MRSPSKFNVIAHRGIE